MYDIQAVCERLPVTGHVLVWLAAMIWEHGLSKTRFGSTMGLLIEAPIKSALKFLFGMGRQQGDQE